MTEMTAIQHKAEMFHGVSRNDLAYRMVSKMGWTEGQGLGANNDGITKHLWTKKRADAVGIGAENSNDWGAHSLQTNVYNSLLAKLEVICNSSGSDSSCSCGSSESESEGSKPKGEAGQKKKTNKDKKRKKGKDKKNAEREADSSDSSSSESESASRKGKKGKDAGKGRAKAYSKGKQESESSGGSSSSSSDSEEDIKGKAASDSTDAHAARKAGRSYAAAAVMQQRYAYKRAFLNKTKDVKSYSSSDLSQILGFSVPAKQQDESLIAKDSIAQYSPADSLKSSRKAVKRDGTDSPADSAKASKKRGETGDNKVKEGKKGQEEQRKGDEGDKKERVRDPVLPKTVLTGILMHMFQHGGFLSNGKPVEQDWIFDDATQERIANDAHASKVEARKGLGFADDRPSKLGKDYTGSKKTFESDGEDQDLAGESEHRHDKDSDKDKKKKRKEAEIREDGLEDQERRKKKKKKKDKKAAEEENEEEDANDKEKKKTKDRKKQVAEQEMDKKEEVPSGEKKKKTLKHAKSSDVGVEPEGGCEEGEKRKKKKKVKCA